MTIDDGSQMGKEKDLRVDEAIGTIESVLEKLSLTEEEREGMAQELKELQEILEKLRNGHVEICVFGEVGAGKSSLLNALLGQSAFVVGAQHGVTTQNSKASWRTQKYTAAGAGSSQVLLVDTPGINEVDGADRAELAARTVRYADIVLFVIDGDFNDIEFSAFSELHSLAKPMVLAINKSDLWSQQQLEQIHGAVASKAAGIIKPENIVFTAADPKPVQCIIEKADGTVSEEMRKPKAQIDQLEMRILSILEAEGKAITALSASLFAHEVSGNVREKVVQIKEDITRKLVKKWALFKATAVGLNPVPILDMVGGMAVDVQMVYAIGEVYGLKPSFLESQSLMREIAKAMGLLGFVELGTHLIAGTLETVSFGLANVVTGAPQAAVAAWSTFVIGNASAEYYKHNGSWGGRNPKDVIRQIMDDADAASIFSEIKGEIANTMKKARSNRSQA